MSLPLTNLDDRTYQQILDEALVRVPVHNPEWTNFNDSDPGVTLIQLFAFMTESIVFRANQIPDRNRLAFLRLLGVKRRPPASARGLVAFSNPRGPLEVRTLAAGVELFAGQAPFRTQDGLDVLPIEAQVYYKGRLSLSETEIQEAEDLYKQLYASYDAPDVALDLYQTKPLEPPTTTASIPVVHLDEDTVDGYLWIALLARTDDERDTARKKIANKVLMLGIVPALSDATRVLPPGGQLTDEEHATLVYEVPNVDPDAEEPVARYVALDARPKDNVLVEPGVVELVLPGEDGLQMWQNLDPLEPGVGDFPPSLEDAAIQERLITWVRIRSGEDELLGAQPSARFSYVGINAARVTQRARVFAELLGRGDGTPNQTTALVNTPVIAESLALNINGELWTEIDDLAAAPPEVPRRSPQTTPGTVAEETSPDDAKVYTLDPATGEIRFGDGLRGMRPPNEAVLLASYDYGGGLAGLVGIDVISKGPTLPAGVKVGNPIDTWGGDNAETIEEAEQRIPGFITHRDRLVSEADFEEITLGTPGVDIARVEVLPLFHPDLPDFPSKGVVTVMVIPAFDPVQPEAPVPDRLFLDTVCRHLNPRRLITTEVHVRGPEYVPVVVSVGITVVPGQDLATVREAVKAELRAFLSPLRGGFEEAGWVLSHTVDALELMAVATRQAGVARVNGLFLSGVSGPSVPTIPISGLQLPRLDKLAVQVGDPMPLADLRGDLDAVAPVDDTAPKKVPIPIVPLEC